MVEKRVVGLEGVRVKAISVVLKLKEKDLPRDRP